jgi:hypothetical protein
VNTPPVLPDCVGVGELSQYYAGMLVESRIEEIDRHLLVCEYCRALAEQVADTTQEVVEQDLAAPLPQFSFLPRAVESALGADVFANMQERIERWARIGAELIVRVQLPSPGEVAAFSFEGIADLLAPSSRFNLELASVAVMRGMRGVGQNLAGPILEIPGWGQRRARVTVDFAEGATFISVQIDNVPAEIPAPLAAVQLKDTGQVFVQPMHHTESASGDPAISDLIADFELAVTTQDVLVLIEPLQP